MGGGAPLSLPLSLAVGIWRRTTVTNNPIILSSLALESGREPKRTKNVFVVVVVGNIEIELLHNNGCLHVALGYEGRTL